ncbi:MAG: helix-turn-helix transcriptional regulator [Muribaculaceae bacterium]
MPSNKNALTRIVLLDKLLADRYHAYSIQDMTDYLEQELPQYGQDGGISKRCVEKDIEYLEYKFPILIEFERYTIDAITMGDRVYKKRCIRYADPTFSIFKKKLTEDEKAVLESALTTLGSFDGLDNFKWLTELREQLKLETRKPIISLSKNLVENSTLIASLFSAISNEQVVELTYRKFLDSTIRKVLISPYLLKEYNRRWYIVGGAYDTNRILNFALDRIVEMEAKTGYVFKLCEIDLEERFEEIIGVTFYEDAPLSQILLWVSDEVKGYINLSTALKSISKENEPTSCVFCILNFIPVISSQLSAVKTSNSFAN